MSQRNTRVLVNGEQSGRISAHDRGLHYGDGLFETLPVLQGQPLFWDRHIKRLSLSCVRLAITMPDEDLLFKEVMWICEGEGRAVLKLIVTRGSETRGYRPDRMACGTRILALHSWPDYPAAFASEGVPVRLCTMRLGSNPALAGMKHLNRLEQVLARAEWDDPAIPEGLMLDRVGHVIEGTQSNVFMVRAGLLMTPDLSACGVAGIMRELILEIAREMSVKTVITQFGLEQLAEAEEIFLCNSLISVWPVRELMGVPYTVGPLTQCIAARLNELDASGY